MKFCHYYLVVLEFFSNENKEVCDRCYRAKQTHNPFPISSNRAKLSFVLIHCDIWASYRKSSYCGVHSFLTMVDDESRATWVYLMFKRSETSQLLKDFIVMVKNQFGHNIKVVRSVNGSEFTSRSMEKFCRDHGILRLSRCVKTPQQNDKV